MAACRSCGAPIVWGLTLNGKTMPLDELPDPHGNVLLYSDGRCRLLDADEILRGVYPDNRYVSHFATCPNASLHRTQKVGV